MDWPSSAQLAGGASTHPGLRTTHDNTVPRTSHTHLYTALCSTLQVRVHLRLLPALAHLAECTKVHFGLHAMLVREGCVKDFNMEG